MDIEKEMEKIFPEEKRVREKIKSIAYKMFEIYKKNHLSLAEIKMVQERLNIIVNNELKA